MLTDPKQQQQQQQMFLNICEPLFPISASSNIYIYIYQFDSLTLTTVMAVLTDVICCSWIIHVDNNCVKGALAGYIHDVLIQTEAKAQRFNHDNMLTQRT